MPQLTINPDEIAAALREMALFLEMEGVPFKPRAYEKAAQPDPPRRPTRGSGRAASARWRRPRRPRGSPATHDASQNGGSAILPG